MKKILIPAAFSLAAIVAQAAIQTVGINQSGTNGSGNANNSTNGSVAIAEFFNTDIATTASAANGNLLQGATLSSTTPFAGSPALSQFGAGFNTTGSVLTNAAGPTDNGSGLQTLTSMSYLQLSGAYATSPTITFNLNTTTNTAGYNISSVVSYASFGYNGAALANQAYSIYYRTVGSSTYTLLSTVNYSPFNGANSASGGQAAGATKVVTNDSVGAPLIGGVDSVQVVFANSGITNSYSALQGTVYNEFAILGTATAVPEPSTYGLMGAGALAAAAMIRRKRRSV